MNLDILYEDNHLLAVNKPAGMLTQPTEQDSNALETHTKQWIKEKYQKPGNVFLGVVHRLDKPVSGIVLFAKTSKALSRLNSAMRAREMKKTYRALVEGVLHEDGTLEHYLSHDDYQAKEDPAGKLARLSYKIVKAHADSTEVSIELETGRYHQIRAQFAASGHPIIGDIKYGSKRKYKRDAIALCHESLEFIHPVTEQLVTIKIKGQFVDF